MQRVALRESSFPTGVSWILPFGSYIALGWVILFAPIWILFMNYVNYHWCRLYELGKTEYLNFMSFWVDRF